MKPLARFAIALCGLLGLGSSFAVTQTPPFASSYSWTSTGPIISAKSDATHNIIAVKDPSAVLYNGRWVIYASTVNSAGSYGMEYLNVAEDWSDAATATPTFLNLGGTAPQIFYFAPQKKWYLITEWGTSYSTNSDPTKPLNWSAQQSLNVQMPSGVSGIDPWIICDSTDCYLFQCADNGNFYRSSTPIGNFPNGWSAAEVVASDSQFAMFEADNVYTVEGTGGYLANIEALGSTGRYFRALWANSLGGTWHDLGDTASFSTPFLGINNTTFESGVTPWTTSFSSGGMLIDGNDQTDSINPDNLRFLYQGASQSAYQNDPYGSIPWQLGLAISKANTITTPSFTLAPSASTLAVTQGSSATDTVSVTDVNGFTGSVTFTASGLPSGVTASFSPTSSTSSSVVTFAASSTATTGNSTVTIKGTSGSTTASTAIALTVNPKVTTGFSLSPSVSNLSIKQGTSGTDTISVTDIGGFTGSVTFTASGLPSGVTASFSPASSTSASVLTLTASSTATTGAFTVTVTGTSGSTTATTNFTLSVTSGGSGACAVTYTISPQNSSQFGATITIKNGGTTALSNWVLAWTFANGQTISSSWNGTVSQSGANVTVSEQAGQSWENIPAGGSYSGFGFNGTWNGTTNAIPTAFSLNGTACTVN
jgi:endo-1,4-beta-xylanase